MLLTIVKYDENHKFTLTSEHVLYTSLLMGLSIIGIYFIFEIVFTQFLIFLLLTSIATPIFTKLYGWNEYYPIDFVQDGTLKIGDTRISANDKEYEYQKMSDLKFLIQDFKGKRLHIPSSSLDSGPSLSQGVDNKIEFVYEKKQVSIQFQLDGEFDLDNLGNKLLELYKAKIPFIEKLDGSKSYGLKHLRYKEIQEFKKEYLD